MYTQDFPDEPQREERRYYDQQEPPQHDPADDAMMLMMADDEDALFAYMYLLDRMTQGQYQGTQQAPWWVWAIGSFLLLAFLIALQI